MNKPIRYLIVLLLTQIIAFSAKAQFPYVESFRAATAPGITFGGAPSAFLTAAGSSSAGGTPIDPLGNGYLRLTNNARNQKGYVYSNANFPSNNGLRVEFEYYIYGGSGADGISFFLFDATADPFVIGGFGGSLGYAQITTTNPISPGVSKGYLAIGLDEFGNFSNPNEGRQGGTGQFPGSVTLRGKGDGSALTTDNYRFLTTALVTNSGFGLVGDGGQRRPLSSSTGYRKVLMEMEPNPAGGYNITVKITRGGATLTTATVINNYYYPDIAPANLRYGFASSTGDQTNFHEVRNVAIEVFNTANLTPVVATNDVFASCTGNIANFDVSLNDNTPNAGAVLVNSSIDLNPNIIGTQTTYTVAGRGTFALQDNGTISFTPSAIFTGTVTANYTIKDNYGVSSNSASITLNYSDPIITPNAGADKIVNITTSPAGSSLEGTEHTGYTGRWTQVSGPSAATFSNPTNKSTFVNNLVGGIYTFRWTIRTSSGCESSDEVQVTVNNRPVANGETISTNLNTDITIPILDNDTDADGNATIDKGTIVIKTQPQHGTLVVDLVSGNVIYRPNTGYTGSDSFTYSVKDNYGAESNIAVVNIGVSLKPIGFNDNANTLTNAAVTIPVITNDPGRVGATVIADTNPTNGSVTLNGDGTITYSPNPGFSGRDVFTYKLRNAGNVESDPITVTVSVKPIGSADVGNTFTNLPITLTEKDNDLSKIGTSVVINTSPTNGTTAVNTAGTISYTPSSGYSGKDSFTYYLRTADGLDSDPILVSLNVRPVGTTDNVTTPINMVININVKDNDLSKTGTTVNTITNPTNGVIATNTPNIVTYTPNTGFSGQDSFTYTLTTADGLVSEPIIVNITIKPVGAADEAGTTTGVPVTIPVKDNDVSKATTTVILNNPPINGTFSVDPLGNVLYTPAPGFSGKDNFNYLLRTADGFESDPIPVVVNVKPTGTPDNIGAVGTTPVNIDVKINDVSKTNTTVQINSNPTKGTVTVSPAGIITFTPNPGFTGNDSFTYTLRTADGLVSDPILVSLTSKPAGSPDLVTTNANTSITILVRDNDQSKTGTTVVLQGVPANGTLTLNPAGDPVYVPNSTFSGIELFNYRLRDANGIESDPILVTVNVKPVGTSDNVFTPLNTPITINIKDNDLSKAGTTAIIVTSPSHGTVAINGAGNAVFTPTAGYTGNDIFTYKLRTADGLESDPITVGIVINPAIPAPNVTVTVPTDGPTTIPVPVPTGGSFTIVTPPAHGTITTDPITGRPIYTPTPGYFGPDTFTYTLKDVNGNESTPGTVTINVIKPAKVGLAKSLVSNTRNTDGSFRLSYLFTLVNYGDVGIERLSLIDNLATAFPGRTFTVTRIAGSGTLRVNSAFNGISTTEMLLATSTLAPNFKEQIELELTFAAGQQGGTFSNSATANGFSVSNGSATTDVSTNGLTPDPTTPGDVTPNIPTPAVVLIAQNINIPVINDRPVVIPIVVPTGGTVVITNPPANGTITINPTTGQPTYTPNPGYNGPDNFTYIIRDGNGNESQPGIVTITVTAPAKIGLAKALVGNIKNADGTVNLTYQFTLVNYGNFAINNVSLTDNLNLAFTGANYQIVSVTTPPASGLIINQGYNGNSATNMLLSTSSLAPLSKQTVTMVLKITLLNETGRFSNFAVARGNSANDATLVEDQSTNGFNPDPVTAGDVTPSELTIVNLTKGTLKIPAGFSPNNDGINDFFVVENTDGKVVTLEVFNRWGNRIYRSKDYKNTWDGRTTEGVYVGNEVPVGTYYYIITLDGKDRKVGVLTINR